MTTETNNDLTATLSELRQLFPDWRMGQMIGNLVQAAGCDSDGAIWEIEDGQLLSAARRLIERNQARNAASVSQ